MWDEQTAFSFFRPSAAVYGLVADRYLIIISARNPEGCIASHVPRGGRLMTNNRDSCLVQQFYIRLSLRHISYRALVLDQAIFFQAQQIEETQAIALLWVLHLLLYWLNGTPPKRILPVLWSHTPIR